ncbi:MAG TPA: PAS domain S-box protein [Gemmatimonadaceae bacterium]|nr:PAS domain S-box protein [Gemmatimonadaceae bacterium]
MDPAAHERATERALRESEERLRFLYENNPTMYFIVDEAGTIQSVNRYGAEYLGYTVGELNGRSVLVVIHPADHEKVRAHLAECIRTPGQVCQWEFRKVRKDGSVIWVQELARAVRQDDSGKLAVLIVCEDITVAKRAAEALRFLTEASSVLASSLDYERTLSAVARLAVPAVADYCMVNVLDARGNVERIVLTHRDPEKEALARERTGRLDQLSDVVRKVLDTGEPVLVRNLSKDELARLIGNEDLARLANQLGTRSVIVTPLRARGRVLGSISLVVSDHDYDESDLELANNLAARAALAVDNATLYRESQRRREELERVTESRALLMRGFSHDVKNPLGAADGYAQVLAEGAFGELSERQLDGIQRIRRSLHTSLDMIQDLLELARAESGQVALELARTDLTAVAHEAAEDFHAQASEAGFALNVDAPEELFIETDSRRVRQVLHNLISNAVKYGRKGSITVTVETKGRGPAPGPGAWVAASVTDTGPGIPVERRERVFQEFASQEHRAPRSSGVGLAISRRIARLLGGDVTLESESGRGSTFTLWLPQARQPERGERGAVRPSPRRRRSRAPKTADR